MSVLLRVRLVVVARLAVLLEGAVEIPDLHVGLHHRLAVQLCEDADDAVHRGMRRPHVDVEVLGALPASRPLAQEQLARVGHQASLRSAIILISARLAFGCASPIRPYTFGPISGWRRLIGESLCCGW